MPTTDPEGWSRICDGSRGPGYVFRRGIELTLELACAVLQPGRRWLDIGCGTGRLLRRLAGTGASVAGIDLNPRMIGLARRSVPAPPPLAVASAACLPFGTGTLDGVTATSLLGCIPDAGPVLSEIQRVLRPHGHAVLTFTNRDSWLLKVNYAVGGRRGGAYHLYGASQIMASLEGLGLEVERVRFYGFVLTAGAWTFPPASVARRLECAGPFWLATRLARNVIVVVRKGVRRS